MPDNEKLQVEYWIAKFFYLGFKVWLYFLLIEAVTKLVFNEKSLPYFKALINIYGGKDYTI